MCEKGTKYNSPGMAYMSVGVSDLVRKNFRGRTVHTYVVGPQLYQDTFFVSQSIGTKGTLDLVRLL